MDFETFVDTLFKFIQQGNNLQLVLYSVVVCVCTQLCKSLFVNTAKAQLLHKYNVAYALPFVFGLVICTVDSFAVQQVTFDVSNVSNVVINSLAVGAIATILYRFAHSFSSRNLDVLLQDDVFGALYNQLLFFSDAKDKIVSGQLSMKQYVAIVVDIAEESKKVIDGDETDEDKKNKLKTIIGNVVDENDVDACVTSVLKALKK